MTDPVKQQKKINDLELTVRTIEDMLPDMPTSSLQKWKGILHTALLKVEKELTAVSLHTCALCFCQEWGYRDDLPTSWYQKGEAEICFQHEYDQAEKDLKAMNRDTDAFFPPEYSPITVDTLRVHMEKNLPPPKSEAEKDLDELMAMV